MKAITDRELKRRTEQQRLALEGGVGAAPRAWEPAALNIAEDMLEGTDAIADHIGKPRRRVYYMCETRQLPVFKLLGKWHMRKSTYAAYIARLEAEATGTAA